MKLLNKEVVACVRIPRWMKKRIVQLAKESVSTESQVIRNAILDMLQRDIKGPLNFPVWPKRHNPKV